MPVVRVQHFTPINSQKILAHLGGFEYFHLVIPINKNIDETIHRGFIFFMNEELCR